MADDKELEQKDLEQEGIFAQPENSAEETQAPKKSEAQMIAEAEEEEAKAKEEKKNAELARLQYYLKQHGYKNDPNPDICPLIAGIQSQGGKLITIVRDGASADNPTAIIDDGRKIKATCPKLNDTCAHVMASEILAKGWNSIKLGGSAENKYLLAAHILAQDPEAKLKGISVTQSLLERAEMLRKTEYAVREKAKREADAQKMPTAEDGETPKTSTPKQEAKSPTVVAAPEAKPSLIVSAEKSKPRSPVTPTRDFPVAGEAQRNFEAAIKNRLEELEDRRRFARDKGKEFEPALTEELKAGNTLLGRIQNSAPGQRRGYRNLIVLGNQELATDPKDVTGVIFRASAASDSFENIRKSAQANAQPSKRKPSSALGAQGQKAAMNVSLT